VERSNSGAVGRGFLAAKVVEELGNRGVGVLVGEELEGSQRHLKQTKVYKPQEPPLIDPEKREGS